MSEMVVKNSAGDLVKIDVDVSDIERDDGRWRRFHIRQIDHAIDLHFGILEKHGQEKFDYEFRMGLIAAGYEPTDRSVPCA